jgi:hypothetical protein
MPIQECQLNGKDGYKWGDEGKCYTYDDSESSKKSAKSKAHRQGIAIEGFNLQSFSKISFDYDDTLTRKDIREEARKLKSSGNDIYIISARNDKEGMLKLADEIGIPHNKVIATGSNRAKIEKVKELKIKKHYDNNKDVISELGSIGKQV